MNWKQQLEQLEKWENWQAAIDLMRQVVIENPDDVEAHIRIIYLLHNFVLEEHPTNEERDFAEELLLKWFNESQKKFSDNTEYLYFIGTILHIAEWYFGIDEGIRPILEKTLAFSMQKKACELEPTNKLFEFACVLSKGEKQKAYQLAKYILFDDKSMTDWLKTKGFPGRYVMGSIEYAYKEYGEIIEPETIVQIKKSMLVSIEAQDILIDVNWEKQLENFEKEEKWLYAISILKRTITDNQNDFEAYIRMIYLLYNIRLGVHPIPLEFDLAAELLPAVVQESQYKFSNNTEYLFFIGKLMNTYADHFMGIKSHYENRTDHPGFQMQKKAFDMEPDNELFEWAHLLSKKDARAGRLAEHLLFEDSTKVNWLKTKGAPGQYILDALELSYGRSVKSVLIALKPKPVEDVN